MKKEIEGKVLITINGKTRDAVGTFSYNMGDDIRPIEDNKGQEFYGFPRLEEPAKTVRTIIHKELLNFSTKSKITYINEEALEKIKAHLVSMDIMNHVEKVARNVSMYMLVSCLKQIKERKVNHG